MSSIEETYSSDSSVEDDAFAAIVSKSMQGLAEAAVDVKKSKEAAVLAAELKKKNDEKSKAGKLATGLSEAMSCTLIALHFLTADEASTLKIPGESPSGISAALKVSLQKFCLTIGAADLGLAAAEA